MSLETAIDGLAAAVGKNTEAILRAVGAPAPAPAKAPGRPAKKDKPVPASKKTGPSQDDVVAQTMLAIEKHKLNEPLRALMTKMGVKNARELKENQYEEYMANVGELIADAVAAKEAKATEESFV